MNTSRRDLHAFLGALAV